MDRDVKAAYEELAKIDRKNKGGNRGRIECGEKSPFYVIKQILQIVPISKSNLYLMIENGEFPKQIKLGKRAVAWSKEDVDKWVADKLSS